MENIDSDNSTELSHDNSFNSTREELTDTSSDSFWEDPMQRVSNLDELFHELQKLMGMANETSEGTSNNCTPSLERLYPIPGQSNFKPQNGQISEIIPQITDTVNMYPVNINGLHDVNQIAKDMYDMLRMTMNVPVTDIIVSEDLRNHILHGNPYKVKADDDVMKTRINAILALVYDIAVINTLTIKWN